MFHSFKGCILAGVKIKNANKIILITPSLRHNHLFLIHLGSCVLTHLKLYKYKVLPGKVCVSVGLVCLFSRLHNVWPAWRREGMHPTTICYHATQLNYY